MRISCDCQFTGEAVFADEAGLGISRERVVDPEVGTDVRVFRLDKTYQPKQAYCPRCGRAYPVKGVNGERN